MDDELHPRSGSGLGLEEMWVPSDCRLRVGVYCIAFISVIHLSVTVGVIFPV